MKMEWNWRLVIGVSVTVLLALAITACTSSTAPASSATAKPEAAPTKAAEPTKPAAAPQAAATAAPTAAPTVAPKVQFPEKGKPITIIVGAAAGGANDVAARLLAPLMEKELGTPVQVVNKPGAGWQVGYTELTHSKPDGYTIGYTPMPSVQAVYLDPDRKATFGRKDFQPLAMHVVDPGAVAVKADSPYKTIKDVIEAAKANPGKVPVSDTGVLGDDHLTILQFQRLTGVKFAIVHFNSASDSYTSLLGGHTEVAFDNVGGFVTMVKSGQVRILGVMDKQESKFLPGIPTMESQGIKLYTSSSRAIAMPAGAPKEVIDTLSAALKKAMADPDHIRKMQETGCEVKYMDPAETSAYWDQVESEVKPLLEEAKKEQ